MMLSFLDKIADWNPQLFRELKGRFKLKSLIFVLGISFIIQAFICFMAWQNQFDLTYKNHQIERLQFLYENDPKQALKECFRTVYCLVDSGDHLTLNWDILWQEFGKQVFLWLSLSLIPALLIGGVYMLVSDLSKEEQQGTLNFIRLSPQKSESILTGKILGVPILLYLGIIASLPLQLWTASLVGISAGFFICFYALIGVSSCFFYSFSILYGLSGGKYAWLASLFVFYASCLSFPFINFLINFELNSNSNWQAINDINVLNFHWFNLPLGQSLAGIYSFVVISLGFVCLGIWKIINRKFRNPTATILSKQQSYIAMACFQGWCLGLIYNLSSQRTDDQIIMSFFFLFIIVPCVFFILISALSPQRQTLQDWARYSRSLHLISVSSSSKNASKPTPYSLWKDLISGEKSPAVMAILMNLLITAAIWIPWILTGPQNGDVFSPSQEFYKLSTILGFILIANFMLICSLVTQLMLMMKTSKRSLWAVGSMGILIVVPLIIFAVFSISPETNPIPWLFSIFPIVSVFYAGKMSVCLVILAQWTVQALLGWQLIRQLQRAGEPPSKSLLAGSHQA